jgi:ATP-dependent 26S proteasome regulatory subunit
MKLQLALSIDYISDYVAHLQFSFFLQDRMRAQQGASCSDIDPMSIDRSLGFDQVGGLTHHVQALKEMVLFPMLYPDVFNKFNVAPPRGVVFYGPPGSLSIRIVLINRAIVGTGKTLVARALANECSRGDKKVTRQAFSY